MREPLRLIMQSREENPMTYIVANALHMHGIDPDLDDITEALGSEQFIDGESMVYLLEKKLSIQTIWRYDPELLLTQGPRHFRDIISEHWTPEEIAMDELLWTAERWRHWQERTQQCLKAFQEAGVRKRRDIRDADIDDVLSASYTDALTLVTLQPNQYETSPALVFATDEHGCLYIYCPAWGADCVRAISRAHFQYIWKWDAGIQVIWR